MKSTSGTRSRSRSSMATAARRLLSSSTVGGAWAVRRERISSTVGIGGDDTVSAMADPPSPRADARGLLALARSDRPAAVKALDALSVEEQVELVCSAPVGERAALLFLVQRADCDAVAPADAIDPAYGRALRRGARAGVELFALGARVGARGIRVERELPVLL